ncbi:hypothetical protein Bpfe_029366, partial [Biomphalaria pfeifferi]
MMTMAPRTPHTSFALTTSYHPTGKKEWRGRQDAKESHGERAGHPLNSHTHTHKYRAIRRYRRAKDKAQITLKLLLTFCLLDQVITLEDNK